MDPFLRFLDREGEGTARLVILGDLFEFLFGFRGKGKKIPPDQPPGAFPEYLPVFQCLQRLSHRGVELQYFEGNHDFSLATFFRDHLGVDMKVITEGAEERLAGRRAYLAHGDLSNPTQWKYRSLRRALKNPLVYGLMRLAGPRIARKAARKLNEWSHRRFHGETPTTSPPAFRDFARQKFLEGYDLVILAHSHVPERVEETVDGRTCLYFNVGDWRRHQSYLRFTPPESFRLERFEG